MQILTRSGTNDFHGTLFEYFRNDKLDANDWFGNQKGLAKPPMRQNDFGGVIGGPILLPRFGEGGRQPWYNGRNKTFFFFSYEGLRLRQPLVGITDVPSLAARQAAPAQIMPYLNAYPRPTGPATGNGIAEFSASFSNPSSLDATSIRIDHVFNEKVTLFGRYNNSPSETIQRAAGGANLSLNTLSSTHNKTQTLTMGSTMTFSPTITNELRFNVSRFEGSNFFTLDTLGGAVLPPDSAFFPSPFSLDDALFTLALTIGRNSGLQIGKNVANLQRQINLVNNLSVTKASHSFKIGLDYRRLSPFFGPRPFSQSITFNGVVGAGGVPTTGTALSGRTSSANVSATDPNTVYFTNFSLYGQDTWRVNPRLTLTYGVRWELNPPPTGEKDLTTVTGFDNPATLTLAPLGTPLFQTTYNNFAPRFGAVYQLSDKPGRETVLRGGVGIFYDLGIGALGDAVISFPYTRVQLLTGNPPFPLAPAIAVPPPFTLDLRSSTTTTVRTIDPEIKLPRTYQWNFAVEQSLGSNQTFSASYVAALGRRLLRQEQINRPNANFFNVMVTRNTATSDYHAMQLQFKRRLSRGLQTVASYSWSNSIDTFSNDSTLVFPSERIDPNIDRGPSDFDVRHSLTGALTYNLPTPRSGAAGKVFGNFSLDANFIARSATPVNVASRTVSLFGVLSLVRPDLITGVPLYLSDSTVAGGRRINRAAFNTNFTGRQGTLGRNALRGFSIYQLDLALRRQFNLTERVNLQLRAEFFNIFNHPNFADPSGDLTAPATFGQSTAMLNKGLGTGGLAGGFSPLYQIGGPRSTQLALRLQF